MHGPAPQERREHLGAGDVGDWRHREENRGSGGSSKSARMAGTMAAAERWRRMAPFDRLVVPPV